MKRPLLIKKVKKKQKKVIKTILPKNRFKAIILNTALNKGYKTNIRIKEKRFNKKRY